MKRIFRVLWLPTFLFILSSSRVGIYLYSNYEHFDTLMHGVGGVAIAFMFLTMQREYKLSWWQPIPRLWKIIFILSFVALFGIAWEWYEFLLDQAYGTHHQPSLADTMYDLLLDLLGATLMCLAKFRSLTNRK